MKKIIFLTPVDARFGFGLSGVEHRSVERAKAAQELEGCMAGPDTGLVVLDERLMDGALEELIREREEAWQGILLVLPSPEKLPPEAEDYAARLIRRAIGYHVRLNV